MLSLATPLSSLHGIGPRFASKLKHLGIYTIRDFLWYFPTRYEDYSEITEIENLTTGQDTTVQGTIIDISGHRTWQKRMIIVEALISDRSGSIRAVWFNQPYIQNILKSGRLANFSGKVGTYKDTLVLSNPTYELVSEHIHHETKHTARIVPVYPETRGLTSKGIRYLLKPILDNLPQIEEIIPENILETYKFPSVTEALRAIHFPNILDEALSAKRRFAFEDLFLLQLSIFRERMKLKKERAAQIHENIPFLKSLLQKLPFTMTHSQKTTLLEIVKDLEHPHPMNRLLQGDVGSGKTVVAALAALHTAHQGHQTAFMAPTEILARQHYETCKKLFPDFHNGLVLLTGSESKLYYDHDLESDMPKEKIIREIEQGNVKIVIGTHALISQSGKSLERRQKGVVFESLALVIIDEQHRFGVRQRATLVKNKSLVPHLLSMSATPIPRTLSLTLFGDLDLSLITELPKNRKPIITKVVAPENRIKAYTFIRGEVKKGRQVFVICPRIEPSENQPSPLDIKKLETKTVKEEYEKLSKKIFPDLKIVMLHGKLKPKEKEKIMSAFARCEYNILVATSVIEVGVDIPNATVIMIESADRFGLAQLYQFRGRVGRGEHQSYCFLFTDSPYKTTQKRLEAIVNAKNGFELAEYDLKLRGPGEFLGDSQTGMPDIAMKAIQNPELVHHAREVGKQLLENDPTLKSYPLLQSRLEEFQHYIHWE